MLIASENIRTLEQFKQWYKQLEQQAVLVAHKESHGHKPMRSYLLLDLAHDAYRVEKTTAVLPDSYRLDTFDDVPAHIQAASEAEVLRLLNKAAAEADAERGQPSRPLKKSVSLEPVISSEASTTMQPAQLPADARHVNLYDDLHAQELLETGPRLYAVDPSWQESAAQLLLQGKGSLILSMGSFDEVEAHLRWLREVKLPDGGEALFRYQDNSVLCKLLPLLPKQKHQQFLGVMQVWACVDACGNTYALLQKTAAQQQTIAAANTFSIDETTYKQLQSALLVNTIRAQMWEVDSSVIANLSPCELLQKTEAAIERAKSHGMSNAVDINLFGMLALQLPAGFDEQEPFKTAVRFKENGFETFERAIHATPSSAWQQWDEKHGA